MHTANEAEILAELQQVREIIARLTAELSEAQGQHDLLLACLLNHRRGQRPACGRGAVVL
jgi:hypothetical protein